MYECGDDISQISQDEAVLIINHQSPNDIGTMMRVLQVNVDTVTFHLIFNGQPIEY